MRVLDLDREGWCIDAMRNASFRLSLTPWSHLLRGVRLALWAAVLWGALGAMTPAAASAGTSPLAARSAELVGKGLENLDRGAYDRARDALERAIVADPANARAYAALGHLEQHLGEADLARKRFDTALSIDPNQPDALNWLGQLELTAGNRDAAAASLARLQRVCAPCRQHEELAALLSAKVPPARSSIQESPTAP